MVFPATAGVGEGPTVVTALNLTTLVTAPVKDAVPITTAINQGQYTGTIAWQTADGNIFGGAAFGAGTVYKAVVTLTAKAGYTFTGVGADSFAYIGATSISNAANSGTVTIVFPATAGTQATVHSFTSVADMSAWLGEQEANTAETPYTVVLAGVSLDSLGNANDRLSSLFTGLNGKFVSLDLSGCIGTSIANCSSPNVASRANKDKLVSLVLPDTLTSIGNYAFYQTTGLVSVDLSGITTLGSSVFSGCTALAAADLSGLTTSGTTAFSNCTALTSVVLSSLTSVANYMFSSCPLTVIDLPASVWSIGSSSLPATLLTLIVRRTAEVVTLSSPNTIPPVIESIYVPDTLVEDYKMANRWSTHQAKIKGLSELPQ
jgi:hypothetical protein